MVVVGDAKRAIISIKTNVARTVSWDARLFPLDTTQSEDDATPMSGMVVMLGHRKQGDGTRDTIIIIRKLRVILFTEFSFVQAGEGVHK